MRVDSPIFDTTKGDPMDKNLDFDAVPDKPQKFGGESARASTTNRQKQCC